MEDMGILGHRAPELRVGHWIDAGSRARAPLHLSDLGDGYKILYCFQHWCPGCHASGFPTLKRLVDALPAEQFGFAVIQTVFEGASINTEDKLRLEQERYGLAIPFGHDTPPVGQHHPTVMQDYRTGGTPWFIIIDPTGTVVFNDFRLDADLLISAMARSSVE